MELCAHDVFPIFFHDGRKYAAESYPSASKTDDPQFGIGRPDPAYGGFHLQTDQWKGSGICFDFGDADLPWTGLGFRGHGSSQFGKEK